MSAAIGAFIAAVAFVTATLSGVFGMAGGLLLMGALALVLPVQAAFVTHHAGSCSWSPTGGARSCTAGSSAGTSSAGMAGVACRRVAGLPVVHALEATAVPAAGDGARPDLAAAALINLDAAKPPQAFVSGLSVTGLNLTAGVAGPLLDIFFVRTALTRHPIVATKAATQVFAHLAKIVVYGAPLVAGGGGGRAAAVGVRACCPAVYHRGSRQRHAGSGRRFAVTTRRPRRRARTAAPVGGHGS